MIDWRKFCLLALAYFLSLPILVRFGVFYHDLVESYLLGFMSEEGAGFASGMIVFVYGSVASALAIVALVYLGMSLIEKREEMPKAIRWMSCRCD